MRFVLFTTAAAAIVTAQLGCGGDDAVFNPTGSSTGGATTTTANGGSGQGGAGQGGSSSSSSVGGSGGNNPGACAAAVAAAAAQGGILYWSTLDDLASLTSPAVGNGAGAQVQTMPADDFVPALSGQGLHLDEDGERAGIALQNNLDPSQGTVDFCYQPFANHTDDQNHPFLGVGIGGGGMGNMPAFISLRKAASNNMDSLQLIASDGNELAEWAALGGDYTMTANTWYRITVSWSFPAGQQPEAHIYLDGIELTATNNLNNLDMPTPGAMSGILIGAVRNQNWHANGILDELVIYDAPIVP